MICIERKKLQVERETRQELVRRSTRYLKTAQGINTAVDDPRSPLCPQHIQLLTAGRSGRKHRCYMLHPKSGRAAGEAMHDLTEPEPQKKGRRQPRVTVRPEALRAAGRYVVLTALCVLCYCNSLRGELVHDDVWAIINNPDVRPGSSLRNIFSNDFWGKMMADNTSHKSYRPLCILSFK